MRSAAVGLLNLTGLGLGYALIRGWLPMAACWIATGILLFVALPADPDGVSGALLIGYLALLALAALHGAYRARRTRLAWPARPWIAAVLGLVLLAAPAGSVALYDDARDEASQQQLLDRLERADRLVRAAKNLPFEQGESRYRKALATYGDLRSDHAGSRAAQRVPDRLKAYYKAVGAPYAAEQYCDAIAPLQHLRTVPRRIGGPDLGSLRTWPDDRLATSLYECGVPDLGTDKKVTASGGHLHQLLTTFPRSPQAAQVEPAVGSAIETAGAQVKNGSPCEAVDELDTLAAQALALPGEKAGLTDALRADAGKARKHIQSGSYACGVDQYRDGDFGAAVDTLDDFVGSYPEDKNRARAKKIIIAATIAKEEPAAGKRLPSTGSGGSIPVKVSNDSPNKIEILYTGPVTGRFTLDACGGCSTYSSSADARGSACKASGKTYPSKTIRLPAGTTYFLQQSKDTSVSTPGTHRTKIESGYTYTQCAYVVDGFDLGD